MKRMLILVLPSLCLLTLGGATAAAQEAPRGACSHWRGPVTLGGATWRVSVARGPKDGAVVDVPSMWRAGHAIEQAFAGDRAAFDLPYSLGRLTGRVVDCRLVGEIVRADGARADVSWDAYTRTTVVREEVRFAINGVAIGATFVRPTSSGRTPAVIVLHGGGDSSRADSPPYTFWGDELAELGFSVLLYDKRGNGASSGSWRTVGFDERAADVVGMADALAARSDIDGNRIGLLAVSQGGWVAARAAQRSKRIAFAAFISAPVVTPFEADTYASWTASRKSGLTAAEADERLSLWRAYAEFVRSGATDETWNALLAAIERARTRPWFPRQPFDPGPRTDPFVGWYPRVAGYDPLPALTTIDIPVLWVYGSADTQSDVGRNVAILTELRDRHDKRYDIAVLPGGDHGVGVPARALRGDTAYVTAAPGFLESVEQWFRERRVR